MKHLRLTWILLFLLILLLGGVGIVAYATWQIQRHFSPKQSPYSAVDLGAKGKAQLDAGDYPTAESYLRQALQKEDDHTYRSQLAVVEYRLKKYPQAISEYRALIAKHQDVAFAQNGIGNANRDWGVEHYGDAEAAYRASYTSDAGYVAAYSNLALLFQAEKKPSEAAQILQQGIASTSDTTLISLKKMLSS